MMKKKKTNITNKMILKIPIILAKKAKFPITIFLPKDLKNLEEKVKH